jgi:dinuclear metal center YbgI/SA1388 family protein
MATGKFAILSADGLNLQLPRDPRMTTAADINQFMAGFAPVELAEDWDNVGLLVGDPGASVHALMTCLTITPESADEAVAGQANLIVTHHPLPFRPLQRLTTDVTASRLLLQLIKADIAVISPHTAFDSAAGGINASLAERFGLANIRPLIPSPELGDMVGAARVGDAAAGTTLQSLIDAARSSLGLPQVRFVGKTAQAVHQVAVCCGSGGSFLETAADSGCDALITGETSFHTCLEARARSVALLLLGHYASERFAVESLAVVLAEQFPDLKVWASRDESDPVQASQIGPLP